MRPAIKAGRPDAAVRQLEPSKSDRLGSGSGEQSTTDFRLLTQYREARRRLDESVMLLDWSVDLLQMVGHFNLALVIDPCEVRRQLAALKRFATRRQRRQ